jgi:protein phosphatase
MINAAARSHPGIVRVENQDRCAQFRSPLGDVFLVADGMGGANGGATAAQMVVDAFRNELTSLPSSMSYAEALQLATRSVAAQVHLRGNDGNPEIAGMGSTVVLALISDHKLVVGHVGDSRAYLYREHRLTRLTRDHTVVQRMVDCGMISEESARNHPEASVLSRAFGQSPQVDLEISAPIDLREGDGVLLCSDGLCGYVGEPALEQTLKQFETTPEEAVSALIQLALETGGEDNVTVSYIHLPPERVSVHEPGNTAFIPKHPDIKRGIRRRTFFVAVAILLGILMVSGLVWYRGTIR